MSANSVQPVDLANDRSVDLAYEVLFRYLAAALSDPQSDGWSLVFDPSAILHAGQAADFLRSEFEDQEFPLGFGELSASALDVAEIFAGNVDASTVRDEYLRVFGLVNCRECPPYETEYQPNEDTFFRSQQMADIAGFYQAFGLTVGFGVRERPDHVALELEFLAFLLTKKRMALETDRKADGELERSVVCEQARQAFFRDHVAWWVPSFSLALRNKAENGFYEAVGRVLAALVAAHRNRMGLAPPQIPLKASWEAPQECEGCVALTNA